MKNFIKKSLITLAVFMAAALPVINFNSASVAADPFYAGSTSSCDTSFLGLTPWDCGVEIYDEESLKKSIWQIATNVAIDITIIAAYLIIGYVIYGGYLYIFSAGEPAKTATGKKALSQAFIGLAIVLSANIIMNSIRIALIGNNALGACVTSDQCISPGQMVTNAIQWVIGIAGIVAAIFVVYGGISYTTSSGDPQKLQAAKRMIMYALIGLIIVAIAEIITAFVSSTIRDANQTSTINQTIISKEIHEKSIH